MISDGQSRAARRVLRLIALAVTCGTVPACHHHVSVSHPPAVGKRAIVQIASAAPLAFVREKTWREFWRGTDTLNLQVRAISGRVIASSADSLGLAVLQVWPGSTAAVHRKVTIRIPGQTRGYQERRLSYRRTALFTGLLVGTVAVIGHAIGEAYGNPFEI